MPEDNKRTSLDVLLSIEEKLSLLIKTVAADQLTSKLILDRLNKSGMINSNNLTDLSTTTHLEHKQIEVENPSISLSDKPISRDARISAVQEGQSIAQAPATEVKKQSFNDATKKTSGKMPVVQRVVDSNNKDVFMASVKIRELSSNEIHFQCKTNAVGKWQAVLPPGKYRAEVVKNVSDGNKIEAYYDFELNNDKPGNLPNLTINK